MRLEALLDAVNSTEDLLLIATKTVGANLVEGTDIFVLGRVEDVSATMAAEDIDTIVDVDINYSRGKFHEGSIQLTAFNGEVNGFDLISRLHVQEKLSTAPYYESIIIGNAVPVRRCKSIW